MKCFPYFPLPLPWDLSPGSSWFTHCCFQSSSEHLPFLRSYNLPRLSQSPPRPSVAQSSGSTSGTCAHIPYKHSPLPFRGLGLAAQLAEVKLCLSAAPQLMGNNHSY